MDQVVKSRGVPDLVVYNAALIRSDEIEGLNAQQYLDSWAVNVDFIADEYWNIYAQAQPEWVLEHLFSAAVCRRPSR